MLWQQLVAGSLLTKKLKWHFGSVTVFRLNEGWLLTFTYCVVGKSFVLFFMSVPLFFFHASSLQYHLVVEEALADINSSTFCCRVLLVSVAVRACLCHKQPPPKVCGPHTVTCDWASTARWPILPTCCRRGGRAELCGNRSTSSHCQLWALHWA